MAADRNRPRFIPRRLPARTLGMCALVALAAFAGSRSLAQSAPAQQTPPAQPDTQQATPTAAQPASDPQSSPAASSSPAPAQKDAAAQPASPAAPTTAAAADQARPPYPGMTPDEKRKQEVAQECADLLKLATDLKAQVDKARKDELSVTVVRKAYELEQMAHKVRSGSALSASNR